MALRKETGRELTAIQARIQEEFGKPNAPEETWTASRALAREAASAMGRENQS